LHCPPDDVLHCTVVNGLRFWGRGSMDRFELEWMWSEGSRGLILVLGVVAAWSGVLGEVDRCSGGGWKPVRKAT